MGDTQGQQEEPTPAELEAIERRVADALGVTPPSGLAERVVRATADRLNGDFAVLDAALADALHADAPEGLAEGIAAATADRLAADPELDVSLAAAMRAAAPARLNDEIYNATAERLDEQATRPVRRRLIGALAPNPPAHLAGAIDDATTDRFAPARVAGWIGPSPARRALAAAVVAFAVGGIIWWATPRPVPVEDPDAFLELLTDARQVDAVADPAADAFGAEIVALSMELEDAELRIQADAFDDLLADRTRQLLDDELWLIELELESASPSL